MAKFTAVLTVLLAWQAGCSSNQAAQTIAGPRVSPLGDSRQLVLVVSDTWQADNARLQCYERSAADQPWRAVGRSVPVSIGRTGLAWGRGLHGDSPLAGPVKREADGKAPAGVFDLSRAFGYSPQQENQGVKLPYIQLTADVVGVDDAKSKHYNQIVRLDQAPAKDWDSFETMRRDDGLYEWGAVVDHNASPAMPGAGSCIFLHVWRGPGKPTAGCTAMSKDQIVRLLAWLDPQSKPLLVQLPQEAYRQLAGPWGLPTFWPPL
jgi:L,D-peptidoglycan transpeptidase YkuD (ErfK/YbiS/YcfS/YnhG family)